MQTETANVIELFVIYKADYSSHNGSFRCSYSILSRITIVSGHMINFLLNKHIIQGYNVIWIYI